MEFVRQPKYETIIPTTQIVDDNFSIKIVTEIPDSTMIELLIVGVKPEQSELHENHSPMGKSADLTNSSNTKIFSTYHKWVQIQLAHLLKSKNFNGADDRYILCRMPTEVGYETGVIGLGNNDSKSQYTILDGFDVEVPNTKHQKIQLNTVACPIIAQKLGKKFANLLVDANVESCCFSFQSTDFTVVTLQSFLESLMLTLKPDERFKVPSKKKNSARKLKKLYIHIIPTNNDTLPNNDAFSEAVNQFKAVIQKFQMTVSGIHLARELGNAPANVCTTESLAKCAMSISKMPNFECNVLGETECLKKSMGAYLSVHAGSKFAPQFIHMIYKGETPKTKVALVGKGICMDTGGYNLKVGCGIETMKIDMCAAAAVLGAAKIIGMLQPKHIQVDFIIPAAENMISSKATRPGDIVVASNGTTIEIGNTDAEGRLTLADALIYAETDVKADYIIDCATLTGACMVGLGQDIAAVYGNNNYLTNAVLRCGQITGTPIWPLPLYSPYKKLLESHIADINNTAKQRYGGSITAALFLKEFIKNTPWCHIDMAGPASDGTTNLATGYGAKLLSELILELEKIA